MYVHVSSSLNGTKTNIMQPPQKFRKYKSIYIAAYGLENTQTIQQPQWLRKYTNYPAASMA